MNGALHHQDQGRKRMNRFALVGKEMYDLVLDRRLLMSMWLMAAAFSIGFTIVLRQPPQAGASPMDFLELIRYIGSLIVGLLAVVVAGDGVARERQERTLHLIFTAPATTTRYWLALVAGQVLAFGVLAALLLAFSALVGFAMGWVALKAMAYVVLALLPLFLTLDLVILAFAARLNNGHTSLLVALIIVLVLWCTSLTGPFGWAFADLPSYAAISSWHPFDLAGNTILALLERGTFSWMSFSKGMVEALLAGIASWTSLTTKEVGR